MEKYVNFFSAIFAFSIFFSGCEISEEVNLRNLEWKESQVLCVYWSPNFEKRDTLPAINFVLTSRAGFTNDPEFFFEFPFKDSIQRIALNVKKVVDTEKEVKIGIALESGNLFPFFEEDFGIEGERGSCHEIDLLQILGQGRLMMRLGEEILEVGKSPYFKFFIGLKN